MSVFGLGSFGQMASQVMMDLPTLITCCILTLVLTILVCIVGLPRAERGETRGVKAFLNFDRLVIASIFKFFYVLLSLGLIIFTLGGFVHFCVESVSSGYASYYGASNWALTIIMMLVSLALSEIGLRVGFELMMLMVKLVENVAAIKARLERHGVADASDAVAPTTPTDGQGVAGGWYGQGVADGYAPAAAYAAGAAQMTRPFPPEPQAVARSYAAPEPPAAWHQEQAYQGHDGYGAGYGHAGSYGQDDGFGAPYDADAYAAAGYDDYDDASFGAHDGAGDVTDSHESATSVLPTSSDATTTLSAREESDDAGEGDDEAWDCPCGAQGNTGNFCAHCGQPRPKGEQA